MKVIRAEKAGFCFGVNRAMELAEDMIASGKHPLYSYGPMIHNEEVVRNLQERGISVIFGADGIKEAGSTVIIRSHGVTKKEHDELLAAGGTVVDGTCPFVSRIQQIAAEDSARGRKVIVVGDPQHAEVRGICGWAKEGAAIVVSSHAEAQALDLQQGCAVTVVSQTTFNYKKFQEIIEIIQKRGYDVKVRNTICDATRQRQEAARALARKVDAMIVIGGKDSSNTRKLYEICLDICERTFLVQTYRDLDPSDFHSFDCVGITAGASTPNIIIEEVQNHVRKF